VIPFCNIHLEVTPDSSKKMLGTAQTTIVELIDLTKAFDIVCGGGLFAILQQLAALPHCCLSPAVSITICKPLFLTMALPQGCFKENVRYPEWIGRDPRFSDFRNPMIIFSDPRDPIFNYRKPNRVPKNP